MATEITVKRSIVVTTQEEVEEHVRTKAKSFNVSVTYAAMSEDEEGEQTAELSEFSRRFYAVEEAKYFARGVKAAPGVTTVDVTNSETGRTLSF